MSKAVEHQDAERLARIRAGLPADVHDPKLEAAYQARAKTPAKAKAAKKEPSKSKASR